MTDKIFAKGFYGNKPRAAAPSFIKGSISIKTADAIEFLKEHTNEKGYVNLDILEGKENKLNIVLNTYNSQNSNNNSPF